MKSKKILTISVAITSYKQVIQKIIKVANTSEANYICVANVHMCMEAFDVEKFRKIVNSTLLTVPDGRPLVWSLYALGEKTAEQIRGADLMIKICDKAQQKGLPIGLYGGSNVSLNGLVKALKKKFPSIYIPFLSSPPFRKLTYIEDQNYIDKINAAGVKILFVGLGCPKQEYWMAEHKDRLKCVMIGVGAAFDFFSGQKKHAPCLMQKMGLEWVFRFFNEPKRLWKRYLKHNPRFIWYFCKQLLGYDFNKNRWEKRVR